MSEGTTRRVGLRLRVMIAISVRVITKYGTKIVFIY